MFSAESDSGPGKVLGWWFTGSCVLAGVRDGLRRGTDHARPCGGAAQSPVGGLDGVGEG